MLVLASAEGVAAITAGATLAAAAGLGFITVYTKRVDVENARALADVDDLRKVLDEAAIAIHDGAEAIFDLKLAFTQHGAAIPDEGRKRAGKRGREVVSLLSRLQVRLGLDDPVVRHFDALSKAIWTAWNETDPLDADAPGELAKRLVSIRNAAKVFNDAADDFIEASVARAGTTTARTRLRFTE